MSQVVAVGPERPDCAILVNAALLRSGADVARGLDAKRFAGASALSPGGSIGRHLRHVAEFYEAFLEGAAHGRVDYGRRRRDAAVEVSPDRAARRLEEIADRIEAIDPYAAGRPIEVSAEGDGRWASSTLARELDVLTSHTVHHYALVAVFLRAVGVEPPAGFGVAPSTLRHWEATTAR